MKLRNALLLAVFSAVAASIVTLIIAASKVITVSKRII